MINLKSFLKNVSCQTRFYNKVTTYSSSVFFSDFFKQRDKAEIDTYNLNLNVDWRYKRLTDTWKKPLERKQKRRERLALAKENEKISEPEKEKFVIHNPALGINLPAQDNAIFAIVQIGGSQFKVVKDDLVIAEKIDGVDINQQLILDKVLLIGTKDYTSIGRPVVASAKVFATVEEQCQTEKLIVMKKKRRTQYKRNYGHKQQVTVLRIDKIEHNVEQSTLDKAVTLL